tara:strand:- start:54 stop:347 length:294 start_codon:yes stop_codon:yes gene_type:complete
MNNYPIVPKVEKEVIKSLHFPKDDVLFSKEDRLIRTHDLKSAISLGNLEHQKVKILFQDIEGLKQVETTIWGVTDREIILKQGSIIPIARIVKINLY